MKHGNSRKLMIALVLHVLSSGLFAQTIKEVASLPAINVNECVWGQVIWFREGLIVPRKNGFSVLDSNGKQLKWISVSHIPLFENRVDVVVREYAGSGYDSAGKEEKKKTREAVMKERWYEFDLPFMQGDIQATSTVLLSYRLRDGLMIPSLSKKIGFEVSLDGVATYMVMKRFFSPFFIFDPAEKRWHMYPEGSGLVAFDRSVTPFFHFFSSGNVAIELVNPGALYKEHIFRIYEIMETKLILVREIAVSGMLKDVASPILSRVEDCTFPLPMNSPVSSFLVKNKDDFITCFGPVPGEIYRYKDGKPYSLGLKKMYQNYLPYSFAISPDKKRFAYFAESGELTIYEIDY